MNVKTFFQQRHSYIHQNFLPNLSKQLPEISFRQRPAAGTQPIIWLLWHMSRVEDMGLSRFVWEKEQLYSDDWHSKLNAPVRHYGTSMTDEEVIEMAEQIDVYAVLEYFLEVGQRTVKELEQLDESKLNEVLDEATVHRIVIEEGLASEKAHWVIPHYVGKTRGWMLCHMGLTHNFRHFGQIVLVRKMLGYG